MADTQDTNEPHGSPFSRPAFVVAGVLVLAIVLLGIIVAVRVSGRNNATAQPPPASTGNTEVTPTPSGTPADSTRSVCGLPDSADLGPLTSPPSVTWAYQGTIAYPQSPELGAGEVAAEGYRFCFQHSPAGALVMAANAFAQGSDQGAGDQWVQYALGEGRYREQLLTRLGSSRGSGGTRVRIAGFRILSYDAGKARVDIGVKASAQNQDLTVSSVYELVWQGGDWKLSADVERPLDVATVPDLSGYVPWGE